MVILLDKANWITTNLYRSGLSLLLFTFYLLRNSGALFLTRRNHCLRMTQNYSLRLQHWIVIQKINNSFEEKNSISKSLEENLYLLKDICFFFVQYFCWKDWLLRMAFDRRSFWVLVDPSFPRILIKLWRIPCLQGDLRLTSSDLIKGIVQNFESKDKFKHLLQSIRWLRRNRWAILVKETGIMVTPENSRFS